MLTHVNPNLFLNFLKTPMIIQIINMQSSHTIPVAIPRLNTKNNVLSHTIHDIAVNFFLILLSIMASTVAII